jgi:flagellar basal body-associated protein FliL
MPQNHARSLREQKPMSRRTKLWITGVVTIVIAATAVAILLTTGGKTKLGCVETYLPGVIGAQTFDECGQDARQTCSTVKENEAQYGTVGQIIVEKACRKGELAIG